MAINWFPLWLSLRVAALATLVSLGLGLWIAYLLANRKFRGKELLDAVVTLPLVLPPTVLGYYLLVVLGRSSPLGQFYEWTFGTPLVFTWQAAVVASTLHAIPLLVKSARAAFDTVDRSYEKAARKFFKQWFWWATHARLKPMAEVAKKLKRHLDNILTYLEHRITNAVAEGLNSKIQQIKSAARGFRKFENYRIAILFFCGKLDMYPQKSQ